MRAAIAAFGAVLFSLAINSSAAQSPNVPAPQDTPYPGVIALHVDVSDVERGIYRVTETVPVAAPGPMVLLYPEWIPGTHAPEGEIEKLAGLTITASGQPVPWRRDPLNVFAFHVDAPAGASALELSFQFVAATAEDQGAIIYSPNIAMLEWNSTLLYPAGHYASRITFSPRVTVPEGWTAATALDGATPNGSTVQYANTTLETLIDSPLMTGRHARRIDLDPGGRIPFFMNVFAERPDQLAATDAQIAKYRNVVRQADHLFGARHFDHYDFLFSVSDVLGFHGLEHHRSSTDGLAGDHFTNWNDNDADGLLPHEMTHSWDGKHRRPRGMATPGPDVPMQDELLWVYEGGTSYWGNLIATRAGLQTIDAALQDLALAAAQYDNRAGRRWRPLVDTTNDPTIAERMPLAWRSYQRSEDYYAEGSLIWLDADTLIRERTGDRRSLDDFARDFFGGEDGDWSVRPYEFDDVVAALNRVTPYDWATFLRDRVERVTPRAPLDGLARGGYRLVYTSERSALQQARETGAASFAYSIGLSIGGNGAVRDVAWDGPAFNQGIIVGAEIVGVDGEAYSADAMRRAITAAATRTDPITLVVKNGSRVRTVLLDYHGGLRYPHLERIPGTRDRLRAIFAPRR